MADIILSGITKKYGDRVLFQDFSLKVEKGEFLSITGESGAGKTTLLNMMGLLEQPDRGNIILFGRRNLKFSSRQAVELRRHKISYLFQNYGLIDTETVMDNMKLAVRFYKISGAERRYERRKIYTLSGGEQQRVALAKVIAKSPQLIFADEPTGSLDEKNREYVLDILKALNRRGKTVVVVTHDPYVDACAKRHICLNHYDQLMRLS